MLHKSYGGIRHKVSIIFFYKPPLFGGFFMGNSGNLLTELFKIIMVQFSTVIKKYKQQGEKTGWTYIEVTAKIAVKLKPGNKKSFRVKGSLDNYMFESLALLPMGEGNFIMALNADIRKQIRKAAGANLKVKLE